LTADLKLEINHDYSTFSENGWLLFAKGYLVATFTDDPAFLDIENSFITPQPKMMSQQNLHYSVLSMRHKIRGAKGVFYPSQGFYLTDHASRRFAQIRVSEGRKQIPWSRWVRWIGPQRIRAWRRFLSSRRHRDTICLEVESIIDSMEMVTLSSQEGKLKLVSLIRRYSHLHRKSRAMI
jgi:hypothetical protein